MPHTDLNILIDAPVERVFRFVADPHNTTRYQRQFSRFEPVGSPQYGLGATADARGRFRGIPVRARLRIVEFVPNKRIVSRSIAFLKSTAEWHFDEEDGKTRVRFAANYDWPIPILGGTIRRMIEEEIDDMAEDSLQDSQEAGRVRGWRGLLTPFRESGGASPRFVSARNAVL